MDIQLKRLLCIACLTGLATSPSAISLDLGDENPNEFQIRAQTVYEPFMRALIAGEVGAVARYLGDALYAQYQTLLEDNSEYPDYLRNYYRDAIFEITQISNEGDTEVVTILVSWPQSETISLVIEATRTSSGTKFNRIY